MNSNNIYDHVIIGAGPCGLTLAYYLGKLKKRCIIIDSNESIGGCHRVMRKNNLFIEHGPRVYSTTFVNTMKMLKDMGSDFYDIFTKYNFKISEIGGKSLENFTTRELYCFTKEFIKLIFNKDIGKTTSMDVFMKNNNFSDNASDYVDRLCRLTDGAGSDRYSLNEFLQLVNQQSMYRLYQPKKPNDIGLFKIIEQAILDTQNVQILLNTEAIVLNKKDGIVISVKTNNGIIRGKNFILAIPPKPLYKLLKESSVPMFKDFYGWTTRNSYIDDIPVIFHWDKHIKLPKVWGFPKLDKNWKIVFIVLSDYMSFTESESKIVISTCITDTNAVSSFNNKTANMCTKEELIKEVFRQLKESFPDLPEPTISIMNPSVYFDKENNRWTDTDTAYVQTSYNENIESTTNIINLYNVGTHNGNNNYKFTSFESAVENALHLFNKLEPVNNIKILRAKTIIDILKCIFIIVILIIIRKYF